MCLKHFHPSLLHFWIRPELVTGTWSIRCFWLFITKQKHECQLQLNYSDYHRRNTLFWPKMPSFYLHNCQIVPPCVLSNCTICAILSTMLLSIIRICLFTRIKSKTINCWNIAKSEYWEQGDRENGEKLLTVQPADTKLIFHHICSECFLHPDSFFRCQFATCACEINIQIHQITGHALLSKQKLN